MTRSARVAEADEAFGEKHFYLEEFRGRSVLIALSPAVTAERPDLSGLATVVAELVRSDTRVLLWWPTATPGGERRLLAALGRAKALPRRAGTRRRMRPVVRVDMATLDVRDEHADLRAQIWEHLRVGHLCVLTVRGFADFPQHPIDLATALRVPKVVLIDDDGGLEMGSGRLSFVDESVLAMLLQEGEAEWSGLGHRRELLRMVWAALTKGVEAMNLCTLSGLAEELFSYVGSGTLFTRGDYCRIEPLGLDQFAQAERLIERGHRDGYLKVRSSEEVAQVLAGGVGALVGGRSLAGVAALVSSPYEADRCGEIVGLYTITRFKGEGVGERLVRRLLEEGEGQGLAYVFACAIDEHAKVFFDRLGFARVEPAEVPAAKWEGYDAKRRRRVAVFKRWLIEEER